MPTAKGKQAFFGSPRGQRCLLACPWGNAAFDFETITYKAV